MDALRKVPVFILEPLQGAIDKAPLGADKNMRPLCRGALNHC